MPRTSRVLVLLHAAERTVLGSVDGGGAAPLEGVEQGRGQELVSQPEQVLERRPALLGRHDFREPPPPRPEVPQLFHDALSRRGPSSASAGASEGVRPPRWSA